MRRVISALFVLGAVAGCTVGPDYKPPETKLPDRWAGTPAGSPGAAGPEDAAKLDRWWSLFKDDKLDDLVRRAVAANPDLKIAAERVVQARAMRDQTSAAFYPTVSGVANAERQRISSTLKLPAIGGPGGAIPLFGVTNTFQTGFDASWELDIFGGTRRAVEAADADIDAAVADRRSVLVSLVADLGADYMGLRVAQARYAIAKRNLSAEQQALDLARQRFGAGLGSELDVAQARAQLSTLEAVVPQLEAIIAGQIHAIAVLLDRLPDDLTAELSVPVDVVPLPPELPTAMPSTVVRCRPDILAAERRVAAANAEIGVAIARYFPKFSLTPSFTVQSGMVHRLLTDGSLSWGFGASISEPIFDGGRISAQVRQAKSVAEENRLAYDKTVLGAFQEVEDALVNYGAERRRHDSLAAAAAADRIAVDRATERYRSGFGDFLAVLDAERSLYGAEDSLAQSDLTEAQQAIALFKALGGGWQSIDPPQTVGGAD